MSRSHRSTPNRPRPTTPTWIPRDRGRSLLLGTLVLFLIGWTVLTWPRLTLPFSAYAPVVHTLDTDVVADAGVGLTGDQLAGIRGAIGTRPIAMVFLPTDGPGESEVCKAVSPRIPAVQLIIVKGDDGRYGCTGRDVPVIGNGDVPDDMRGLAYELRLNAALQFVADPVAKAQAAALVHDSMIANGRLEPAERSLRTPWAQVALTVLIVGAVLAGILLVLTGLRWLASYLRARNARRREQERLRDELDDALAELALAVVDATPDDPRAVGTDADRAVERAAGYVDLLTRARTASGGWGGLLRRARELLDSTEVRR